jgi:hypothetical protein
VKYNCVYFWEHRQWNVSVPPIVRLQIQGLLCLEEIRGEYQSAGTPAVLGVIAEGPPAWKMRSEKYNGEN